MLVIYRPVHYFFGVASNQMHNSQIIWLIGSRLLPYVSGANPEQTLLACPLANARLRMAVAAGAWKHAGGNNFYCWDDESGAAPPAFEASIFIVPKFYPDSVLHFWLDACRSAKDAGCEIVLDICEFPFHKKWGVSEFYEKGLALCNAVVVNSEKMAELVRPYSPVAPVLIEDAVFGPPRKHEFSPKRRLELLWFGHPTNLRYLRANLGGLAELAQKISVRLTIVTEIGSQLAQLDTEMRSLYAELEFRVVPWSLESNRIAMRQCDLVLLPGDPSDPRKCAVSANRIAEALCAGRFPIASPLASYVPFSDCAWIGNDIAEGVRWAVANRGEVMARIRRGQERVALIYSPEKIAARWMDLFAGLKSTRTQ